MKIFFALLSTLALVGWYAFLWHACEIRMETSVPGFIGFAVLGLALTASTVGLWTD